jgi:hypothetical protein
MDYLLVYYLIKILRRFSVACHYKVYIVDSLLRTLLCSKTRGSIRAHAYVKVYVRVVFVVYNLRVHYWFSSRVCKHSQ